MFVRIVAMTLALMLAAGATARAAGGAIAYGSPSAPAGAATAGHSPTAAAADETPTPPGEGGAGVLTASDLEAYFDGLVPYAMHSGDIAGGVVVVVKDGAVLFAKGYGYADIAERKAVDVDRTLFRAGSISKTVTWTAVMQLVAAGKIDLDADVNRYLDFRIPEKFGKPVTMRDLMTMTPGFENTIRDQFLASPGQLFPLGEYLRRNLPARIYPPGEIVAYSNYGAVLAGYIVQRVSGEPFDRYVEAHVFEPLDMSHSTFEQPLPADLAPRMSVGYHAASNPRTIPFEIIEVGPAGSMTTTGADMARFMIAQLDGGSHGGASILPPAMLGLMHSPQSRMAPGVNGYGLGVYQEDRNGVRVFGHGGDTMAFHSDMHLLPDERIGVFMSFNSAGKQGAVGKLRTALFRGFLDRYYPHAPAPQEPLVADPMPDAARVVGWYLSSRRIVSGLKLVNAFTQTRVSVNPDGTLRIGALTDLAGSPKTWREVAPLTYREVGGQAYTKFVTDSDGRVRYWISTDFLPVEVFQPVHGLQRFGVLKPLGTAFIATLVLTLAIWIGGAIVRRRTRTRLVLTRSQFWWRLASRVGVVLLLLLLAGWAWLFGYISATASGTLDGFLAGLYGLGLLATAGAIAMLVEASLRVVRGPGGWLVRAGEFVLGLCALYALWGVLVYGLVDFSFRY